MKNSPPQGGIVMATQLPPRRLVLMGVMVFLATLVMLLVATEPARWYLISTSDGRAQAVAQNIANNEKISLDAANSQVQGVATDLQSVELASSGPILDKVVSNGGYELAFVTDGAGVVVASKPANRIPTGNNQSSQTWYRALQSSHEHPYTSGVISVGNVTPALTGRIIATRISKGTEVKGYVVIAQNLQPELNAVKDAAERDGLGVVIVDPSGTIAASSLSSVGMDKVDVRVEQTAAIAGKSGFEQFSQLIEQGPGIAYAGTGQYGWGLVTVTSYAPIADLARQLRLAALLGALGLLLLTMLAGAGLEWWARRQDKRTKELAEEISKGSKWLETVGEAARTASSDIGTWGMNALVQAAAKLIRCDLAVLVQLVDGKVAEMAYWTRLGIMEDEVKLVMEGTIMNLADAGIDVVALRAQEDGTDWGGSNWLALNLMAGSERLGFLAVVKRSDPGFKEEDEIFLEELSGHSVNLLQAMQHEAEREQILAEVDSANDQIANATQVKGAFLASMSHELRTPIAAIMGFSDILLQGLDGEMEDEQRDDVRRIKENGQHLLNTINSILDSAKLDAGKMILDMGLVDASKVVEQAEAEWRKSCEAKGLELQLEIPQGSWVVADEMRLAQLFKIMVANSIKYTTNGGVAIFSEAQDGFIQFIVQDSGVGITPADLPVIFEELREGSDGKKKRAINLSLAKKLVQAMNGEIGADSEEGAGSLFWFRLKTPEMIIYGDDEPTTN